MANRAHLAKLREGLAAWNAWRSEFELIPYLIGATLRDADLRRSDFSLARFDGADLRDSDFSGSNLHGAILSKANLAAATLRRANLSGALLRGTDLSGSELSVANVRGADLRNANLCGANLDRSDFRDADLTGANLGGAYLGGANLSRANLSKTILKGATLQSAIAIKTNFAGADLSGCSVYGISAWDLDLEGAIQSNLRITPDAEPTIQVDNLEVAQFIYLLLNNRRIRQVIDTITSKVVLILGRFTPERKLVLDALRNELRNRDRLPVLFDFDKPANQTTDETIATLAHMARFVIADLTDAKSVLQEIRAIVPNSPSVVVQPVLLSSQEEPGMWDFYKNFRSVLKPVRYTDKNKLIADLGAQIIDPAEAMARELAAGA
jgi:uncharacterized protein YjbI with pentapeptide repeats